MKMYVIVLILTVARTQRFHENNYLKECSAEHNLTYTTLIKYYDALDDDRKDVHVISECFFRKLGNIENSGKIIFANLKKIRLYSFTMHNTRLLVDRCSKLTGGNIIGEKVSIFMKCVLAFAYKIWSWRYETLRQKYVIKICAERNNLSNLALEGYFKILPKNRQQIQVFSECYLLEHGCLGRDGSLLPKVFKRRYPFDWTYVQFQILIDQCSSVSGSNTAETSYKFLNCLFNQSKPQSNVGKVYTGNNNGSLAQTEIQDQEETNQQSGKHQHALKICSAAGNFSISSINDYNKAVMTDNQQIKLFSECYFRELGYLNGSGTILYEEVKKATLHSIPTEQYSVIVDKCKSLNQTESAEEPYKFSKCVVQLQSEQKHIVYLKACANRYNLKIQNFKDYTKVLTKPGLRESLLSECYLRSTGYLNNSNTIIYEKVKIFTPRGVLRDKYANFVDFCKNATAQYAIDVSYAFLKCLQGYVYPWTPPLTKKIPSKGIQQVKKKSSPTPLPQKRQQASKVNTDEEDDKEEEKQPKGTQHLDVDT
ncbi:hypothetical protein FQA39_LY15822 [Lamprigera yunnana]|nr:hypothetical protein FQA39_LY15822 [Lamprigera yunnana]